MSEIGTSGQFICYKTGQFYLLTTEKSITIYIPGYFRDATDGQLEAKVHGKTVKECLDDLIRQFPRMRDKLYNKKGKLITAVEIYVNRKSAYPEELAKSVNYGDEIHITILLACPNFFQLVGSKLIRKG
jgi:molybdopterin converting factor small subunit